MRLLCAIVLAVGMAGAINGCSVASAKDKKPAASSKAHVIAGYLETAWIEDAQTALTAKLDTGATNSSIHAEDIEPFTKGGKDWVRFTIVGDDEKPATIERPVERHVRIKGRTGSNYRREVVLLTLCVGGISETVEVNLADRTRYNHDMLIGRSFLKHGVLIDSGRRRMLPKACGRVSD